MKVQTPLMSVALLAAATPAAAGSLQAPSDAAAPATPQKQDHAADKPATSDVVTTGVAKGRDRLDSAVSTSSLKQAEILKLAPRSVAEILRDVPGIRSESARGEGNASISIRGLPIASVGSKFLQVQEDGLPVLEFGDISFASPDTFLRADLNLAQVEVIRGGSASTFASNSPGGIINFISHTGETEGGAVQTSVGLDYRDYRLDFAYGTKLSDTLRTHIGGFYRRGEGPRRTGYDAAQGGQIKVNVTKDLASGYIRLYGKYLDDRTPIYDVVPMRVSGSDDKPEFTHIANFDARKDTLLSRYLTDSVTLDGNNNLVANDVRDGQHSIVKSVGAETQVEIAGWTVMNRFRFAAMSNHIIGAFNARVGPAGAVATALGGPGATLRYANGPNAGQVIAAPATLNGNGLLAPFLLVDTDVSSVDNVTNDLRLSRVWKVHGGDLTTTAGMYTARQAYDADYLWSSVLSEVRGNGEAALIDIIDAKGTPVTQDGVHGYGASYFGGGFRRKYRLDYSINAPFGSINYRIGRFAFGASLRYDFGHASGSLYSADLGGGRIGNISRDMNADGVISAAETRVSVLPLTRPVSVDYRYGYLSYSAGVNFRIAEPLAVFARYSRGGRANAERLPFSPLLNNATGKPTDKGAAVDFVRQAEVGVKYRQADLTLNLTGFYAKNEDTNIDVTTGGLIAREYQGKGFEFEGGYRHGPFSLTTGVTYTDAKIVRDFVNPAAEGKTPRHQAKIIFQATPQITTDQFSVGAVFIGTTDSYAQDNNVLKMPGYVTTNAFVQFRPTQRLLLSVTSNNLFNVTALTSIDAATIPASGIAGVYPLTGRTTSASVRFDF